MHNFLTSIKNLEKSKFIALSVFMQMTLKNFEHLVDAKIAERGLNYANKGHIPKVEQIGAGEFSAVAYGSKDYDVYVRLDGETVSEHECACPYDWGDVCKHVVGVLYKIRSGGFSNTGDQTGEILNNLHADALRKFVSNLLKKDRKFRRTFLREFDEDFEEDEDGFDEDYY